MGRGYSPGNEKICHLEIRAPKDVEIRAPKDVESRAPTDLEIKNKFLSNFSLFITQEEFANLLATKKLEIELPLTKSSDLLQKSHGPCGRGLLPRARVG